MILFASAAGAPPVHDPGPRPGASAAGGPLNGVTVYEKRSFLAGRSAFDDEVSVTGTIPATEKGLGPRFNLDRCSGCHAYPSMGGTRPAHNPQTEVATKAGANNKVPWFVTSEGPVMVARFRRFPDGSPDGSVHALFTIAGRTDVPQPTCQISQPDFERERNNVALRIPTPLFGLGLVEVIPDAAILRNITSSTDQKRALGIAGRASRSPNDGTVSRFGWKAQNRSLLLFTGESYNVEMGVTNELFPGERDEAPGCTFVASPQDQHAYSAATRDLTFPDIVRLADFVRFLAPPVRAPETDASRRGSKVFGDVGCALCHVGTYTTGVAASAALTGQQVSPYSDFLIHHMGAGLADGISQGDAGPDEFRTAPLWGVGQRIFLLHDGRTTDLLEAIRFPCRRLRASVPPDALVPASRLGRVSRQTHYRIPSEGYAAEGEFEQIQFLFGHTSVQTTAGQCYL